MKHDTLKCSDQVSPDRQEAAQANVFGHIKTILICWNCGEELWADSNERFVTCTHCGSLVNAEAALR
jgi:ribosomal protein S27E